MYKHFDFYKDSVNDDSWFRPKKRTLKEKLYKLFFPRAYKIKKLESEIEDIKKLIGDTFALQPSLYDRLFNTPVSEQTICSQIMKIRAVINDLKRNQDDFNKLLLEHF